MSNYSDYALRHCRTNVRHWFTSYHTMCPVDNCLHCGAPKHLVVASQKAQRKRQAAAKKKEKR